MVQVGDFIIAFFKDFLRAVYYGMLWITVKVFLVYNKSIAMLEKIINFLGKKNIPVVLAVFFMLIVAGILSIFKNSASIEKKTTEGPQAFLAVGNEITYPASSKQWKKALSEIKENMTNVAEDVSGDIFYEKKQKLEIPPVLNTPVSVPEAKKQARLTDEEYFVGFYGQEMINRFNKSLDFLVSQGFLKRENKINIKTESDMNVFFNIYLSYGAGKSTLINNRESQLRQGLNIVLPELWSREHSYMEERILKERGLSCSAVLNRVLAFWAPQKASAQQNEVTNPECYREGTNGSQGTNGWAMCCNCGEFCSEGCEWFDDCGPQSASCNVYHGCLNSNCQGVAAIWDQETGICGCSGSGGGGGGDMGGGGGGGGGGFGGGGGMGGGGMGGGGLFGGGGMPDGFDWDDFLTIVTNGDSECGVLPGDVAGALNCYVSNLVMGGEE